MMWIARDLGGQTVHPGATREAGSDLHRKEVRAPRGRNLF